MDRRNNSGEQKGNDTLDILYDTNATALLTDEERGLENQGDDEVSVAAPSAYLTMKTFMYASVVQPGSVVVLFSLVSYVVATAFTESLSDPKSLYALLLGSFFVSFSLETIKLLLNMSAMLKKDFNLYWGVDAVQMLLLMSWACGFNFLGMGENWSPVGYNAAVTVPGIAMQLANNLIIAPYARTHLPENGFVNQRLFPETTQGVHQDRWYNPLALHGARYAILMSAMIAGSELFAQMKTNPQAKDSIGGDLVEFFELCDATAGAAIFAAALLTNEELGMTFFLGADWFKDAHASHTSRAMTLVGMSALFQGLSTVEPFFAKESFGILLVAATATFLADLGVQYTIGHSIDTAANKAVSYVLTPVDEAIGVVVDSVAYSAGELLTKYGIMQTPTASQAASQSYATVPNPMHEHS